MEIREVVFAGSFADLNGCPKTGLPEFAMIGRSNVGKSSLINLLCDRHNLAHTSGKPGKTQTFNYFLVNQQWYLVDMPGYGFARVSLAQRKQWEKLIHTYLVHRTTLQYAFVLIDPNVPPQKSDITFINCLGENQVPFVLVYTKTDRLKTQKDKANVELFRKTLSESWNALPAEFFASALRKTGRNEILKFIENILSASVCPI